MPCKTETQQIGDYEFSVTQWTPDKALLMKMRLMKVIGPSFAKLIELIKEKDAETEGDIDASILANTVSESIHILFENGSPEEVSALIKECILGTAVHGHPEIKDGQRITDSTFNQLFSGDDFYRIYQVFFFVVKVNYLGFIKGQYAGRVLAKFKDRMRREIGD